MKKHLLTRLGLPPIVLEPGKVFTFGRDATSSLPIPVQKVSRQHAEIRWSEAGRPIVVDLGSSNGTFIAGRRVAEHALKEGDELQIGPFVGNYQFADPADLQKAAQSLTARLSRTTGEAAPTLTGTIDESGLAEFLQSLEMNGKTGTLNAYDRQVFAWVTLCDGAPAAAEAGERRDADAVFHMLDLKHGRFVFEPDLKVPEKRMSTTVTALLLEWSKRPKAT